MGTTYSITLVDRLRPAELQEIKAAVERELVAVNTQMSTWDPNSEISQFNATQTLSNIVGQASLYSESLCSTHGQEHTRSRIREACPTTPLRHDKADWMPEPFPVSPEFAEVVRRALEMSFLTDGAFDPTVKPLVDHWGFGVRQISNIEYRISNDSLVGRASRIRERVAGTGSPNTEKPVLQDLGATVPSLHVLTEIMQSVGWKKVRVEEGALIKTHPKLQLDLSAIAKGYGVDAVADVIRSFGLKNFLVEIGGEIAVSGLNREKKSWRVGIESPNGTELFQALELRGGAMATSGDYRNFRTREDGTRFSHIIDPATGHPAETDVASVSVLATSCMDADAVATALFVMGSENGMQWISEHSEFEALFILHSTHGTFTARSTSGFQNKHGNAHSY